MAEVSIATFGQAESTGGYSPSTATVGYRITISATQELVEDGNATTASPNWSAKHTSLPTGVLLRLTVEANDGEMPHSTYIEETF